MMDQSREAQARGADGGMRPPTTAEDTRRRRNAHAREARRIREEVLRSCGLVKVRGATTGRTFWE